MKRLFILISFGIVLLAACTQPTETPKKSEPLKIGLCLWAGYAYTFVAQEQGFFKNHGVEVELVFKKDYEEIINRYKAGEVDGILSVFTDVMTLNGEGLPTQAVYVTDYPEKGDVIVGRAELKDLSELKGKTISFEGLGSFSQLLVVKLLEKAGVQEGEFKTANVLGSEVLNALEAGTIDAGHTWEPLVTQALKKGYKILGSAAEIPGVIVSTLAFKKEVVEQRPDEVQAVVNAMVDAFDFVQTHREQAVAIMAKSEGVSEAEMAQGISNIHLLNLAENVAAMQSGGMLFKSGEMITDFFQKKGQFPQLPNIQSIIDPKFVQTVKLH